MKLQFDRRLVLTGVLIVYGFGSQLSAQRSRLGDGQRASALRFGDPLVQALLAALLAFRVLPDGFQNRNLRDRSSACSWRRTTATA